MAKTEGHLQNRAIQKRLRELDKLTDQQRKSDRFKVMESPAGRRFMYDVLFEQCGLMNLYPAQDSGIYRHEGKREVGFKLASVIQQELPGFYVQMITEHTQQEAEHQKLREAAIALPTDEDGDDNA